MHHSRTPAGLLALTAALSVATLPVQAADLKGATPLAEIVGGTPSRWHGAYWGLGLSLASTGVDVSGVGPKHERDLEGGSLGVFAFAGYNYMIGRWLAGVEADFGGGGLDRKKTLSGLGSVKAEQVPFGSVRARFGYAWDRTLVYATAGVALSRVEVSSSLGGKDSGNDVGAVVGFGAEYALDDAWRLRGETLLYAFEHDSATLAGSRREIDSGNVSLRLGLVRKF